MPTCPKCNIPLCRIEVQRVPVHSCPDCGGELIEELRLKAVERRADPEWTEHQKDDFCRLADTSNDLAEVLCPRCSRQMNKFLFRSYANVQVDQCPECQCYWLDAGKMEKMQIFYAEEMAGRTEEDWDRIERAAVAEMAADTQQFELRSGFGARTNRSLSPGILRGTFGAPEGRLAGSLLGMYLLDRKLDRIDDIDGSTTSDVADQDESTARGRHPAALAGYAVGVLLVALAVWALWRWLLGSI